MNELFWKICFLLLFLTWVSVRVYYGKKAAVQKTKEKIRPRLESGLVGLNFIGMMLLPLITVFTPFLDAYTVPVPDPVRFAFLIITTFNIWLFAMIHRDLGGNWSPILEVKKGHHLVKTGAYKRIRHPIRPPLDMGHCAGFPSCQRACPYIRDRCVGPALSHTGVERGGHVNCRIRR